MKIIFLRVVISFVYFNFFTTISWRYILFGSQPSSVPLSYPILLLHKRNFKLSNYQCVFLGDVLLGLASETLFFLKKKVYKLKIKTSQLLHILKVHGKECFLVHFKATVDHPKHDR